MRQSEVLKGKVAVVTGASKGIGAGIAKLLAAQGASVVVNYASSKMDADQVVEAITGNGGKAIAVKCSVDNKSEIQQLFAAASETYGKVDIVINNAAGGCIINIGSIGSQYPTANSCIYSSTKGVLDTLSKVLAVELASRNIRVNTIAPGATETEGLRSMGAAGNEIKERLIASTPLGRMGQSEDIASVVAFLASDAAGWITGERIKVTGRA